MTLRIKSPQDVGAAIILIAIGLAGLWFGRDYDIGSVSRMGPGYMPALLSIGLLVFGAVIGLRAITVDGTGTVRNGTIEVDYDAAGRRSTETEPDGTVTEYVWNAIDQLVEIVRTTPAGETTGVRIDLDALGDTRALWRAWLQSAGPVLGVDDVELPADRGQAAAELDRRGAGNWLRNRRISADSAISRARRS